MFDWVKPISQLNMNSFLFFKKFSIKGLKTAMLLALFATLLTSCAKRQQDDPVNNVDKSKQGIETNASFPGGIEAFYAYLEANIQYPAVARENNVQGKVIIVFVIDTDGSVTEVKVLQGIGSGCDEEAARVIKLSPKWTPGMQNGRAVRQQFTIPISFTLTNSDSQKQTGIVVGRIL